MHVHSKVIYPKYSKHWPYTVASSINCECSKMLNHGLNHGLFHFQAYTLPHTLNCICVSLFEFRIWILKQFYHCPKRLALPRHIKIQVSIELFGALYMYISNSAFENVRTYLLPSMRHNKYSWLQILSVGWGRRPYWYQLFFAMNLSLN